MSRSGIRPAFVAALLLVSQTAAAQVPATERFTMPAEVRILTRVHAPSPCFDHAVAELTRLLARLGTTVSTSPRKLTGVPWQIQLVASDGAPLDVPAPEGLRSDGYAITITTNGVALQGIEAKGILNAVYDLAERLGFLFIYPGVEGEWPPEVSDSRPSLPLEATFVNPRFPHRGVFNGNSEEEWAGYYAKLRLNTICNPIERDRRSRP
jgi:hypothetical protein